MKSKTLKAARTLSVALALAVLSAVALAQSIPPAPHSKIIRGEPINAAPAAQNPPPAPAATTPASIASQPPLSPQVIWNMASLPKIGDYLNIGFDGLASFEYEAPDVAVKGQTGKTDVADKYIPDYIKGLDGKKVIIKGFMIPLLVKEGKVVELLMMRNQSTCCFGTAPKITEFISVKITGRGVPAMMDVPVNLEGTLHVGTARENGFITEIYRMDGERLVDDAGN
jgi:hypothetical protein